MDQPPAVDPTPAERLHGLLGKLEAEPARAKLTYRTRTALGAEGLHCEAPTRKGVVAADEPKGVGGTDQAPNPVEIVLAGLATCQAITYRVWAMKLGIALDGIAVEAEGDVDTKGFFGLGDVRAGFERVRLAVTLTGPEPHRHAELAEAVDQHCPVLDMLRAPVPVEITVADST